MTSRTWILSIGFAVAALAGGARFEPASAEAPAAPFTGFKRTELARHDLSMPNRESVTARADIAAGAVSPKHTHPGEEIAYVLEGEVTVEIDGKPAAKVKAGETFFIPPNTAHIARNATKAAAVVISTYLVEKGKPLATPVK